MSKTAVGIYISPKYVDIVELAGSRNAPVYINFIRQQIAAGSVSSDTETIEIKSSAQDSITTAVREGFERLRSKPQSIQTVLASSDVMIRYFDMPTLPKSEQAQAVRFEAKKYVPFKLDDITSDFKVSIGVKNKNNMDIFFMAATKAQINSYVARFNGTGASVASIDIMPLTLWQVLLLHKKVDPKDRLVILYADNDKESVSIHIVEAGMPFMSRDFKIAIDDKEAVFEKIASELRVSLDYYSRQKHSALISQVVICGEVLFPGLDAYIADELKVVTNSFYDFSKVKNADNVSSSAIVALGSALEGLGQSNYSVNFSPLSATIKHRKTYSIIMIEVIVAIAVIVLCYLLSSFLIKGTTIELEDVKKQAKPLPANTSHLSLKKLIARKESMLKDVELLSLVVNNRVSWAVKLACIANDLSSVNTEMPTGAWLNSLTIEEDFTQSDSDYPLDIARRIFISGSSFSLDSSKEIVCINAFFTALKNDAVFMDYLSNIDLGSIDKKDVEDYLISTFTIAAYSGEAINANDSQPQMRRTSRR